MKKDFFKDSKIKYPAYEPWISDEDKKNVRTFASYEVNDELFSDRNVFPKGCIVKMEKIKLWCLNNTKINLWSGNYTTEKKLCVLLLGLL